MFVIVRKTLCLSFITTLPCNCPDASRGFTGKRHQASQQLHSCQKQKFLGQVGWFLHTPFPSSEIYRTLPVREEVLRAVLKADLIGFHTYDYARHFVSACTRILGLEVGVLSFPSACGTACFGTGVN